MENKQTIFITGASSGIGLETAALFFQQGWNVIATMRKPQDRQTKLHQLGLPDLIHLDVLDAASIQSAVQYAVEKFGAIDVLVNNAGYANYGPFEAASPDQIQRQFDTNLFGLMSVTRAVLPVMRAQKHGAIINVASMGGRVGFPLYSLYNSSKWAVEGFTEALRFELEPFGIKVRLIEPGVIKTDFYDRSLDGDIPQEWRDTYHDILSQADPNPGGGGITPDAVARVIHQAAVDQGSRLRYIAGADAKLVSTLRKLLPEPLFLAIIRKAVLK
jgi:NAD(P)-dependent dehydrogenase (short-subunit alcohol dehydrogenase family)